MIAYPIETEATVTVTVYSVVFTGSFWLNIVESIPVTDTARIEYYRAMAKDMDLEIEIVAD